MHHRNAWELMVATILSAQCTDARVNMVTPALFKKFPTPTDFAHAPLVEIEEQIRSTGFYHNKAKSLNGAARKLTDEYSGKVPQTMEELLTLPGVARKTANVVLGVAFGKAVGVVVDTHVLRLSRRLELTKATEPIHGGKRPDENHSPGPLDRFFPRNDPPRAPDLHCPQAALCRLHLGAVVLSRAIRHGVATTYRSDGLMPGFASNTRDYSAATIIDSVYMAVR